MDAVSPPRFSKRYNLVTKEKAHGVTYTPTILADFVSEQIAGAMPRFPESRPLRILDPAIGHGELILSLLAHVSGKSGTAIEIYGYETDSDALEEAEKRIKERFPDVTIHFSYSSFLDYILEDCGWGEGSDLFRSDLPAKFDLIIANPPYVRTQVMGAEKAKLLAKQFSLSGRVDLYYAFLLGMSEVLAPSGVAGIIVSNRFMTTKSGAPVREALLDRFTIKHAWDLGDTKLFEAAVLPAVLLLEGKGGPKNATPEFTTIYETADETAQRATDPLDALKHEGAVEVDDGRHFLVQHGTLHTNGSKGGVWRVATKTLDDWLTTIEENSWGKFRDIGKIRVGVKTCADKVFIRNDWENISEQERPELLRPLTTHHIARRYKALAKETPTQIIYPHEVVGGKRRSVDLSEYPKSAAYLEGHKETLAGRKYVLEAGRDWFEIWVPQDPEAWEKVKLVFRDISEEPTFWIDVSGSVVNGDCYWMVSDKAGNDDLLWLAAAVGNSRFIEKFYDRKFQNKLYAGRRRFITQYVQEFPLPNPNSETGKAIVELAKQISDATPSPEKETLQGKLDELIWKAFRVSASS